MNVIWCIDNIQSLFFQLTSLWSPNMCFSEVIVMLRDTVKLESVILTSLKH